MRFIIRSDIIDFRLVMYKLLVDILVYTNQNNLDSDKTIT